MLKPLFSRRIRISTTLSEELATRAEEFMKKRGAQRGFFRDALAMGVNLKTGGQIQLHAELFDLKESNKKLYAVAELYKKELLKAQDKIKKLEEEINASEKN